MIRYYSVCFWVCMYIFQLDAQVQTLHNTLAKGTLHVSGGLYFPKISEQEFIKSNNFTFGINYCFKHHYTLGLESNLSAWKHTLNSPEATWSSKNVLAGINLQRNDLLFKTKLGKFKITSIVAISGGGVFSSDTLTEQNQVKKSSFGQTGLYVSSSLGLRFEFIRRLFIEVKESGGYLVKNSVKLRLSDQNKITSNNWYTETQIKLGIFMFINTLDKCGTCPKW